MTPRTGSSDGSSRQLRSGDATICRELRVADRAAARMRGLLGTRELAAGSGLWITPCSSIHMLFMRYAIDAVFVDADLQIVRIHHQVRPWRFARGGRRARSVFELPAGTAARHGLQVGDALSVTAPS